MNEIRPVADIVADLVKGYDEAVERMNAAR
jgi:hypothetical protein